MNERIYEDVEIQALGVPTLKKIHPIWLGDEYFKQFS